LLAHLCAKPVVLKLHNTACTSDYRRGFGLRTRLTTLTHDSWLHFTVHCHPQKTRAHAHTQCSQSTTVSTNRCLVTACKDVPLTLDSKTIPCLSYQLLTSTTHNEWTAVLWQTHYLTNHLFTSLHCIESDKWVLCYDRRSVGQSALEWSTNLGLTTIFLLLSDSCVFLDVGRSLTRGRVCRLQLLLALGSTVILGSESHILLSQIPFSSPPATRRATVEAFDSASTREWIRCTLWLFC
jgi:hypothetical protein